MGDTLKRINSLGLGPSVALHEDGGLTYAVVPLALLRLMNETMHRSGVVLRLMSPAHALR